MIVPRLWTVQKIVEHLDCLGILNVEVFLLALFCTEVRVHDLPQPLPFFPIRHEQGMRIVRYQILDDMEIGSGGVDGALLVDEILDNLGTLEHDNVARPELEVDDGTIPFAQTVEPEIPASLGKLVEVSNERFCGWSRWVVCRPPADPRTFFMSRTRNTLVFSEIGDGNDTSRSMHQ